MKKILLVGGGTGGHIIPLLAVADEIMRISGGSVRVDYIGPKGAFAGEFESRGITVHTVVSSKLRRYFSPANIFALPKLAFGFVESFLKLVFVIRPDVIFSKGGPGALAVLLAARVCFVPIIVHESDTVPGRTNRISGNFARKVIVAFAAAGKYFKNKNIILIGNPVRSVLLANVPESRSARSILGLEPNRPTVFIVGGSQGAARINQFVIDNFEDIMKHFQIIHQAGAANLSSLPGKRAGYLTFGFMNVEEMKSAYAAADLVVSRAGANSIAEIAAFGKPAILVPIPQNVAGEHQIVNAYEYAKTGAAIVIEETNLTPNVFIAEAEKIIGDNELNKKMSAAAGGFGKPNAAELIAREILSI
jgi:UDP-N-acetylglucosamine--N-acetylmuramyl-(pentapeptide) pyrophosphoryl-undecaprenol N-acetylglucosamine transferase